MIVNVAYEVPQESFDRAAAVVERMACYEAGFFGAELARGEFTCVPDDESYDACVLLSEVQHAINDDLSA